MGVEYGGFCHDCKQFIDGHKCFYATQLIERAKSTQSPTFSDFASFDRLGYWDARLLWFMLAHALHNAEVISDSCDQYFDFEGKYTEVSSYEEMEQQKERVQSKCSHFWCNEPARPAREVCPHCYLRKDIVPR